MDLGCLLSEYKLEKIFDQLLNKIDRDSIKTFSSNMKPSFNEMAIYEYCSKIAAILIIDYDFYKDICFKVKFRDQLFENLMNSMGYKIENGICCISQKPSTNNLEEIILRHLNHTLIFQGNSLRSTDKKPRTKSTSDATASNEKQSTTSGQSERRCNARSSQNEESVQSNSGISFNPENFNSGDFVNVIADMGTIDIEANSMNSQQRSIDTNMSFNSANFDLSMLGQAFADYDGSIRFGTTSIKPNKNS